MTEGRVKPNDYNCYTIDYMCRFNMNGLVRKLVNLFIELVNQNLKIPLDWVF